MIYKTTIIEIKLIRIIMKKTTLPLLLVIIFASMFGCEKDETTDAHWSLLSSGTKNDLYKISFTSNNIGYVLADSGLILKTTNEGKTWKTMQIGISMWFTSFCFSDDNIGYVVGTNGIILKTVDGGNTWKPLSSGTIYHFTAVLFVNTNIGYVIGGNLFSDVGIILKTTDGGNTWNDLSSRISSKWLYSIYFIDANTGYLVGDSGTILKTTNGGDSWTNLPSGTNKVLGSVFFTSENTGFASGGNNVGDEGIILRTDNGGSTWTALSSGTRSVGSLFFPSNDIGYAISYDANLKGLILKTDNGGIAWSIASTDLISTNLSSVFFTNVNKGYIVGEGGTIIKWGE